MHFEHLIQINDPQDPAVPPMTRDELWRGLMHRVETPQRFPLGPDECRLHAADAPDELRRDVIFGKLRFEDTVRMVHQHAVDFEPRPHGDQPPVSLRIAIEEPTPEALFLRFRYQSEEPPGGAEPGLQALREQAWLEHDRDMVRTLRLWLAEGRL
jgi:hypothetical protein